MVCENMMREQSIETEQHKDKVWLECDALGGGVGRQCYQSVCCGHVNGPILEALSAPSAALRCQEVVAANTTANYCTVHKPRVVILINNACLQSTLCRVILLTCLLKSDDKVIIV